MTLRETPAVSNIPAGFGFADTLARGLLERAARDAQSLGQCVVLLPNRRAARTLREAFLRLSGGGAVLLPRLQPLGDVDAEEVSLLLAGTGEMPDIPPAVPPLERQLLLAHTLMRAGMAQAFDQAAALARELARFLDEVQTEGLEFSALANLVPEAFAGHWQKTLAYLSVVTEHWPGLLRSRGMVDAAARRNMLLAAQAAAWERHPPDYPVIAAGSTGTVPAAAALLHLVARLPQGEVVLPGLDEGMDDAAWAAVGADHPQHNMKRLLERFGVSRTAVRPWKTDNPPPVNRARVRLLSEALRPAGATETWRALTADDIPAAALDGFIRVDCATPQEEADVIALLLRGALEEKGKTAALITPDRRLARRVTLSLKRWGIDIDDSGGQPLTELPVGAWLMLTAEMAAAALAPVALLSCLKHPFMAAGMAPGELRGMTWLLDRLALRGPRPSGGFSGLRAALETLAEDRPEDGARLKAWLEKIAPLAEDFTQAMSGRAPVPFRDLLAAHVKMAEDLAAAQDASGGARLWRGEAGEAAAEFLHSLLHSAAGVPPLPPSEYLSLLGTLLKTVTVRARYGMHPRLSIMGQVEARLYCADMVILGGLNEGTWPALPAHDPWMSRPMRRDFGLPAPERSVSLAAHDFVQAAAAPEVYLTRARKVDGAPTVPARWLLRMETVLSAAGLEWNMNEERKLRRWARLLDDPGHAPRPVPRPAPCPPPAARPRSVSVTQVEAWMRDPYQIYARKVLDLRALDPVDADPGGAERGTFIHAALDAFICAFPGDLPADAPARLTDFGRAALREMRVPREVEAFWWPRFEKIARIFVAQEREWREQAAPLRTEVSGAWHFTAAGGPFALTGKADRIDRFRDGTYAVIDYKSGFTPENADVRRGLSPQLPLEALMLGMGAFAEAGVPAGETSALIYWRVTGSGQKPVERKAVAPRGWTVERLVEEAGAGFCALVDRFDDGTTPYISQPRADDRPRFSDYDHLARVREWGVAGEGE